MALFLTNTLTRKKEEFVPLAPPQVNMYTCGVTVYDESHIGHARSLYVFDVIRRYLEYRGFRVRFVRNITDIDDKIINRANQLKKDWQALVAEYIGRYYDDLDALGIRKGDAEPRATENIPEMIRYIQGLIDKGFAYEAGGDVYFAVRKFPVYGKLSGQGIDQMQAGSRIEPTESKRDTLDFALWKKSKENEPWWESPWGKGRPGWHIECSVMSQKFLATDTLDIHAGGRDLVFPHHENEVAQAEAFTGKPFAKYWIHHGLLTINGQKMSKSLGNFITIRDILKKHSADALKIFFLSTHYAHPIDFTEEKIREAEIACNRFAQLSERCAQIGITSENCTVPFSDSVVDSLRHDFETAMDDDFNTAQALAVLFKLVSMTDGYFTNYKKNIEKIAYAKSIFDTIVDIFGFFLKQRHLEAGIAENTKVPEATDIEIHGFIALRNEARHRKDFKEADRIRKELETRRIILEDTKDGTIWRRV